MVLPEESPELIERVSAWLLLSQKVAFPYEVEVAGTCLTVFRGVFSPAFYSESAFYARNVIKRLRSGMTYLDLGCGVGLSAILAAEAGAQVVALDVNSAAVANTKHNAERAGVDIDVRASDIFSGLNDAESFDLIFWNVPFAFRNSDTTLTPLEEAIFDPGYRKNHEFLSQCLDHLRPGGEVVMGVSSTLGSWTTLLEHAEGLGLGVELLATAAEDGPETATFLQLLCVTRQRDDILIRAAPSSQGGVA